MILQSLKSHPTTPLNILQWIQFDFSRLIVWGIVCCLPLGFSQYAAAEKPQAVSPAANKQVDPLQRLKNRSAENRFRELSKLFKKKQAQSRMTLKQSMQSLSGKSDKQKPVEKNNTQSPPEQLPTGTARHLITGKSINISEEPQVIPPIAQFPSANQSDIQSTDSGSDDHPVSESSITKVTIEQSQSKQLPVDQDDSLGNEDVKSVDDLRRITEILPYFDYEPDAEIAKNDPCRNLCPRPDGKPCTPGKAKADVPLCPTEVQLTSKKYDGRLFGESFFHWEASNVHYNPLYFEDVQMERYGHTYNACVQPFVSVTKFGTQLVGLPYQMSIDPICKKIYPLGYYRPGEAAPRLHYQVPLNAKAAAAEAGVLTGLIFLIP